MREAQIISHRGQVKDPTGGVCAEALSRGGGGVLPYMGYIGMCGAKGYGFLAVLVINRVSLLAILPPFW